MSESRPNALLASYFPTIMTMTKPIPVMETTTTTTGTGITKGHQYQVPRKYILIPEQLTAFQASKTHGDIIGYIEKLNDAVVGVPLTMECSESEGVKGVLRVLERVRSLAEETPPVDNSGSRFGNPAFRTFYDKLGQMLPELHAGIPGMQTDAIPEVSVYFQESWGNRTRIDYGSGMELNFLCWMYCLEEMGAFDESDHTALVTRVFWRYMNVMRDLQKSYWLEPAGSHGVWGLDDYHFLPFLFGSAQLKNHPFFRPKSIHNAEILEEYSKDYMYFACIQFINSIKSASLRWHSPMLDDISGAKSWEKINTGMKKMYRVEVLGKLPVVQHFLFGSFLVYDGPMVATAGEHGGGEEEEAEGCGYHAHSESASAGSVRQQGWGDCCGIPVPSVFGAAAAEEGRKMGGGRLEGAGIRPVPFD